MVIQNMLVVSVWLPLVRAIAVGCMLPLPNYTSFSNGSVIIQHAVG